MRFRRKTSAIVIGLVISAVSASAGWSQDDSGQELLKEYRRTYQQHLTKEKVGLVPLYSSVNYRVGDVWDPTMTRLLEEADDCFPGIQLRTSSDSISTLAYSQEAAAGFLFGLEKLFSASATANLAHSVKVTFSGVVEEVASEGDLRRSFSAANCPNVAAIVGLEEITPGSLVGVVIGRIYRGERHIEITYGDGAKAKVRSEELAAIATGANVTVEVSGEVSNSRSVVIADATPVPLGFSPAFLPLRVGGTTMGNNAPEDQVYAWRAFDPETNPSQLQAIAELTGAVESEWSWHDTP